MQGVEDLEAGGVSILRAFQGFRGRGSCLQVRQSFFFHAPATHLIATLQHVLPDMTVVDVNLSESNLV
jgi:hypothetical protein